MAPAPAQEADPDSGALAPPRATAGCIVTETPIDGWIHLRFEARGAPLANLRDAEARLNLDSDPRVVELERGGVMLRTPYDAVERPLHLRRALALGGVITPQPHAEIFALAASGHGQVVQYVTGAELGRAAIEQAVACADITLNTQAYEVRAETEPPGTPVQLMGKLGVSATPGGPASLQLDLGSGILVDELERRAGQVKIRMDTETELLLGWVPESSVGAARVGRGGGGSSSGMGFDHHRMKTHIQYTACPRPLTLFAERENRLAEVGVVRAGTPFEVSASVERGPVAGFSEVKFWQRWIVTDSSARFMLPSADLAGCQALR